MCGGLHDFGTIGADWNGMEQIGAGLEGIGRGIGARLELIGALCVGLWRGIGGQCVGALERIGARLESNVWGF